MLWFRHSVVSEWVKNAAAVAAARRVLLPAMIEPARLPLEFRRKHTADLSDWHGELSHSSFHALCEGVSATLRGVRSPSPHLNRSHALGWRQAGYRVGPWR